jgi:hypothetical protein
MPWGAVLHGQMDLEEQLLTEAIRNTLHEAQTAKTKFFRLLDGARVAEDGELDFQTREAQEHFKYLLEKAYRDLAILAERLSLPKLRKDIVGTRKGHKDITNLEVSDYDIELHSPPLADAWSYFDSLSAMTVGRAVSGLGIFETILGNTGRLIAERCLQPHKETQVHDEIEKVLKLCFSNVAREIPLHQPLKTYKPDVGVPELMAAVEYKFIDSKAKAKTAVGGIYEDLRGYSAHRDRWRNFYAVFYMSEPFMTQKELDTEWRLVGADRSWTPMIVHGPMGPKPAAKKPRRNSGGATTPQ